MAPLRLERQFRVSDVGGAVSASSRTRIPDDDPRRGRHDDGPGRFLWDPGDHLTECGHFAGIPGLLRQDDPRASGAVPDREFRLAGLPPGRSAPRFLRLWDSLTA